LSLSLGTSAGPFKKIGSFANRPQTGLMLRSPSGARNQRLLTGSELLKPRKLRRRQSVEAHVFDQVSLPIEGHEVPGTCGTHLVAQRTVVHVGQEDPYGRQ